jgi:HAE1 family hydrophobic/amphiphilic exporter-1
VKGLVRFAVTHPVTVSMATVASVVFGLVALARLDLRLLPEVRYPSLTLQTDFPNTAPLDVENLVTRPIEEAVGVVPGLRRVHSISQAGLSQVTLEFDWDTDMDYAALEVREKIDLLQMPDDAGTPVLLRYDPSLDPVLRIGLGGRAPLAATRALAEDVLKKELESLRGVAAAKVSGGLEEEIRVQVDEARLAAVGLSIADVESALAQENVNASGGRLRDRDAEYLVRTLSRFDDLEGILGVIVGSRDGHAIRLAEIADVHRGHKERTTITHVDGRESVEIAIHKEGDENVVDVARRVRAHLESLREHLPPELEMNVLFDQSVFIRNAVQEVRDNAIAGGLLAVLVLWLFLRDVRSTVIIALSIPLSIVATFVLMYARNVSLNVMSLGGLALGVGMLVDNSIVVLESIARRREARDAGRSAPREAVVEGAGEVAAAVAGSTLTTVAVFVPIVFVVEGIAGQIFGDQALTVTFSLLVSLLVALTFAPMVAALGSAKRAGSEAAPRRSWRELVPGGRGPRWLRALPARLFVGAPAAILARAARTGSSLGRLAGPATLVADRASAWMDRLGGQYRLLLRAALMRPGRVLGGVGVLVLASLALAATLGTELIPPLAQGQVTLAVELPEGTPLTKTDAAVARLGRALREIPGVENVFSNVGVSEEGGGTIARRKENRADIHLQLADVSREGEARVLEQARAICRGFPDASYKVRRPSLLTLATPLEVDVYGYDLDALSATAGSVADEIAAVRGIRDVRVSIVPGSPEVRVLFDRDKLNRLGLTLSGVSRTVQSKVRGAVASQFRDEERHIDIRVQNAEDQRNTLDAISDLIVAERGGVPIRLGSIASFDVARGPAEIHRLARRRVAIVSGNLAGRDLGSASEEVRGRLAALALPAGVTVELGGQNEEMQRSFRSLVTATLLAVFLVYLVMAVQFESFLYPFVIMFTVPLALLGAIVGLGATRTPVSILVAIGAIMLAGIVVNNGIVLVDRINQLRRRLPLAEAVLDAARERLRPILLTTGTTVLGLLPMALGLGEGAELRAPLAITVISGLSVATILTLFVVPVVYLLLTPGSKGLEPAAETAGERPVVGRLVADAAPGGR